MFGARAENPSRASHFANAARRFALDAKMFRCRAAVHVENKDDIAFWGAVLKHFRPDDKFHFISGSRNEYGRETCGVTQCLKYFDFLSPDFFICIDSDYRYLLRERKIDVKHFVLQTYTYSFENHHCFADGLDDVCSRVTHLKNTVFDFRRFLSDFSRSFHMASLLSECRSRAFQPVRIRCLHQLVQFQSFSFGIRQRGPGVG